MALNDFTNKNSNNNNNDQKDNISSLFSSIIPNQDDDFDIKEFAINYNQKYKMADPALFRDDIIAQTMAILIGKNKANALLVGAAGTGKTKIVEEIARRIEEDDPTVPEALRDSVVWELPLSSIVAGSGIVGQLEQKVKTIINYLEEPSNKAILFIDEIHQLGNNNDTTYNKIAQILKPAMARGTLKIIGATTISEVNTLASDPAFNRRFSRVLVDELSKEETFTILESFANSLVKFHGNKLKITNDTLTQTINIADKIFSNTLKRPDSAITLLDRTAGEAIIERGIKELLINDENTLKAFKAVPFVSISEKQLTKTAKTIMTGSSKIKEITKEDLEKALSSIKGQDGIKEKVIKTINFYNLDLFPKEKPLSMLFAGPSGTGKTEITKLISYALNNKPPITLNMTEYNSSASINRIIGSPDGYVGSDSKHELPFDILDTNPYQVILLDEFEKADEAVQRLFMGALDEGYIKTAKGKIIDFSKSIIIATTNAGHTENKKTIGFRMDENKSEDNKVDSTLFKNFDIALLNRFKSVHTFNYLEKETYIEILKNAYKSSVKTIKTHSRVNISDEISDKDALNLADKNYQKEFGARKIKQIIEDFISESLIN